MERQVIFRDRQEFQAADMENLQSFVDQSLQHLIGDAITGERMYVGLTVTSPSSTEIQVSAGRLWDGGEGKVYRKDQAETISVFSHLPVSDERWLAVAVIGQEVEIDIQPRDFLVDLQSGQTEPRAVAMERQRQVVIHLTPGIESSAPQKPEPPTGYTLIAYVRLSTSGVQEIEQAENRQLMRLFETFQQARSNAEQLAHIAPLIASITTELSNLGNQLLALQGQVDVSELAADVALLKDRLDLPDDYTSYGGDLFLDPEESDTENTEFYARVEEGIRMPWAGETEQQPALFNPYASEVKNLDGLILPDFEEVVRLRVAGKSGELAIGQYTYETHEMRQGTRTRVRIRYGPTREVCTNGVGWRQGGYDFVKNVFEGPAHGFQELARYGYHKGHHWKRIREYWRDTYQETYWYVETTTHTISGSQIAETFMAPSSGWITGINLYLTKPAENGIVYLHLMEAALGMPNKERCFAAAEVAPAGLKTYPQPTYFRFAQPVYVTAGERYAFTVTTAGNHKLATVHGTRLSSGTLFHSTDGAYYQGDFTRDIMFDLVYADFKSARTTVELAPLSLSGGIADLDLLMEATIPEATELIIEYQKSGDSAWYPVAEGTADQLLGLPALLHLRATFVGSRECMPGLALPGSRFRASRPATSFRHISKPRSLGAPSEDIEVILDLEAWDGDKHTCTCKLLSGGNEYLPDSTSDQARTYTVNGQQIPALRRTFNFKPEPGSGISEYQIQIEGSTTTALQCFHVAKRMDIAK